MDYVAAGAPQSTHANRILSTRELNRTLLSRQLLLRRAEMPVLDALEHLAGMQAQNPYPPYYGLWSRLTDFQPEHLAERLLDRSAVRIVLMRGTIHLVTAQDCLRMRPLTQPVLERWLQGSVLKQLEGVDLDELESAGRALVEEKPRTFSELGIRLGERWPGYSADALTGVIRCRLPLVQIPPRGIWGEGGLAVHTTAESWIGEPLAEDASLPSLIMQYLTAFGPASVKDVQVWSGLTRIQAAIEQLRPYLRTYRDEAGQELFDVLEAELPDPDTPAPVRFLGEFDNMLLAYHDRSRIMNASIKPRVFTKNGIIRAAVLVDGFVRGIWSIEERKGTATLTVELFGPISDTEKQDMEEEGWRLLQFAAPDAAHHDIQLYLP
ncbi:winged helix DNA-binding domain-containing protein [Paenibacillus xanthanilyticus]|uniref:Winged helix DNA-binding domain-containing protein n=1 Tax=Paenibacillus xanthanilyticus TaxID=1783531 RepID=A0ABV8KB40_9BACL